MWCMFWVMDIRTALKSRGHTQRDLALRVGVSESMVSRWLAWVEDKACGTPIPSGVLATVAEMAGVTADELLAAVAAPARHEAA